MPSTVEILHAAYKRPGVTPAQRDIIWQIARSVAWVYAREGMNSWVGPSEGSVEMFMRAVTQGRNLSWELPRSECHYVRSSLRKQYKWAETDAQRALVRRLGEVLLKDKELRWFINEVTELEVRVTQEGRGNVLGSLRGSD
jgi:hypothetical protein